MESVETLVDLLRYRATVQPDCLAYAFLEDGKTLTHSLTYRDLDRKARSIAAVLQAHYAVGDRVLLIFPQGTEFLTALFGCLYAGLIAIPAPAPDPARLKRTLPRLQAIVTDAQASLVLTCSQLLSQKGAIDALKTSTSDMVSLPDIPWLAVDAIGSDLSDLTEQWQLPQVDADQLAYLQYTSGSTSTPKGVMLSHRNLVHHLQDIQQFCGYTPESISITWMPYFHDYGLVEGMLEPLYNGTPCYLMSPFAFIKHPFRWLKAISSYRATHSQAPNFAYAHCSDRIHEAQRQELDLSCWQAAGNAAEPINPLVIEQFCQTFAICGFRPSAFAPGYGLAEATLIITTSRINQSPVLLTVVPESLAQHQVVQAAVGQTLISCGQAVERTQIRIVHPETLVECASDEIGEIWVQSPGVAQGYWNHPIETKQSFRACLADAELGSFLRTGDLGFLKDGELFVTGRIKDLIIIHGQNYYPQDIEWIVEKSHPALKTHGGAAFSIEVEGSEQLVIVHEVERQIQTELTQATLPGEQIEEMAAAICRAVADEWELAVYSIIFLKRGSLPKTSSGKIQRQRCRQTFLQGSLNNLGSWTRKAVLDQNLAIPRDEVEIDLMHIWRNELQIKSTIGINQNFFELGGNSLVAAQIILAIEQHFQQKVSLSDILTNPTIAQLAEMITHPYLRTSRSLVALRSTGTKRPFFYIHPLNGSVFHFRHLIPYFDAKRPLYGLKSVGSDGQQEPFTQVEVMAKHYLKEIRTVQPQGPYLLGGRCFGGIIALEMAEQLLAQGEEVSLVALVEVPYSKIIAPEMLKQVERPIRKLEATGIQEGINFYKVLAANRKAQDSYSIKPFSRKIVYFAAEESIHDPADGFGWQPLASGGLDVCTLPGTHYNFDIEPYVATFADCLNACLNDADTEASHLLRRGRLNQIQTELHRSQINLQRIKQELALHLTP